MTETLIVTFIADDRPGLVEKLSDIVSSQSGNWLESRMAHLAAKFAGIIRVEVAAGQMASLRENLLALRDQGFQITVDTAGEFAAGAGPSFDLDLVGPDQPGILRDITKCLAANGASVEEMETAIEDAPMGGGLLFKASARITLPAGTDAESLGRALEEIAGALMVDISLNEDRG